MEAGWGVARMVASRWRVHSTEEGFGEAPRKKPLEDVLPHAGAETYNARSGATQFRA